MTAFRTRTAIQTVRPGVAAVQTDVSAPRVRPDYVIAETKAFALNPTDYHHVDRLAAPGLIIGCDWSGIVREVGGNVTRFKPGDAVYGVCHGGNNSEPEDGAFADMIACKEHTMMHKPDSLSFEESASLGVALVTVGQALYWVMKLPLPSPNIAPNSGPSLLVYGGSSATGTIAIQSAKLSGMRVYTTCSPSNRELVKSRGADAWFDYNQPDCIEQLKATGVSFPFIVDCIGSEESSVFCSKVLSPSGGHYHSIKAPLPEMFKAHRPEESAVATTALGYTMLGEDFEMPGIATIPADPAQENFAKEWALLADNLVANGHIRPHAVQVREGGLDGVLRGLEEMRSSGPRGQKMVYLQDESEKRWN
ncbi:uncharacterized protein N7459_000053 [Penicillium hispanicum]|uniref:uncharacterized protein n=1 Tax=Penicillium hispanicum TaxID=1080232 RepID=UPI0025406C3B|nr:uncharacterized protein N7459_000053 [Penicillium hispanicum]KAJ5593845.1 hypothetical protein N7459_000053 [Penicillium hispanicum]